jgi:hypothetical protein
MAERHSTRPKAGLSARRHNAPKRHPTRRGITSNRSARSRPSKRPSTIVRAVAKRELASELHGIARLLGVVYSTCVTAELALQGQNADQDHDILSALRVHVSEPVSRQIEKLDSIAAALGGRVREGRL